MREDESNWFSKWEEQLPSPHDLIPLSQTLISPDLAIAFDIRNTPTTTTTTTPITNNNNIIVPQNPATPAAQTPNSSEFDSSGGGGDEPARTLKRPRLVWTPQLHKRFVDAVAHLGIKNSLPKTIMQLMSVDGLTRENVASHLQKYRLYLKRMQGLSTGSGGSDPATDHLFASSPVPAHFLHPGRGIGDHFLGFVPVEALQQHLQQQQQNVVGAGGVVGQHYRSVGHFGGTANGQFVEHSFMARQQRSQQQQQQQQQQVGRMVGTPVRGSVVANGNVGDLDSAAAVANGRKVLTLFPTGDD